MDQAVFYHFIARTFVLIYLILYHRSRRRGLSQGRRASVFHHLWLCFMAVMDMHLAVVDGSVLDVAVAVYISVLVSSQEVINFPFFNDAFIIIYHTYILGLYTNNVYTDCYSHTFPPAKLKLSQTSSQQLEFVPDAIMSSKTSCCVKRLCLRTDELVAAILALYIVYSKLYVCS